MRKRVNWVNDFGRSMIEMLGVLAIVGVLSVGGIAGFNKAMFKYRLQKTTEEYNQLFQEVLRNEKELRSLSKGDGTYNYIGQLLFDMGMVPVTWAKVGNAIYDRLNTKIQSTVRSDKRIVFDLYLKTDDTSIFVCEAIYRDVVMQYSNSLRYVYVYSRDSEGASSGEGRYYGDIYCNGITRKCIKDRTPTDIREVCSACEEDDEKCVLAVAF